MDRRSVHSAHREIGKGREVEGTAEGAIEESAGFFTARVKAPAEGMPGSAEGRDPRHIVEELIGVGDAPLRIIISSAEHGVTAGNGNGRQAGVEQILAAVDDAGERLSIGAEEDFGGVEAGVLHGEESLIPREAESKIVEQGRRKSVGLGDDAGAADRGVAGSAQLGERASGYGGSFELGPTAGEAVPIAEVVIDLEETGIVEGGGGDIGDVVDGCAGGIRRRPELENRFGDRIGDHGALGGGGYARRTHGGIHLAKAFPGGEEESLIATDRTAGIGAELVAVKSVLSTPQAIG